MANEYPTFARCTAATQGLRNEVGILKKLVFEGEVKRLDF